MNISEIKTLSFDMCTYIDFENTFTCKINGFYEKILTLKVSRHLELMSPQLICVHLIFPLGMPLFRWVQNRDQGICTRKLTR